MRGRMLPCPICEGYDFFGELVSEAEWIIQNGIFTFELQSPIKTECPRCRNPITISLKENAEEAKQ